MPNYTDNLRLTLQIAGENDSTWGDVANSVFNLLEDAIAGLVSVSVTSLDVTLTANSGAADQARAMVVEITGSPGVARNVICPAQTKVYLVNNKTSGGQTITFKTAAGTGVALVANAPTWVYCDGTNVVEAKASNATNADTATLAADSTLFGGLSTSDYAQLAVANLFTKAQSTERVTLVSGATVAINASLSNAFRLVVGQNLTINNPTGGVDGQTIRIQLKQGAGGPYSIAYGSAWKFPSGIAPDLTQVVGAVDYLAAEWNSSDAIWMAAMSKDFS